MINGKVSFWMADTTIEWPATRALNRAESFDVAVVGGGYTGLWTAYWLLQHDPTLAVAVFEANDLGFGASGRNGGWLSSKQVGIRRALARGPKGREGVREMEQIVRRSVDEVVQLLGAKELRARHGGWMQIARSTSELARLEKYVATAHDWGVPEGAMQLLSADEARERVDVTRTVGALYSPEGYTLDPARMVSELAKAVIASGGQVFTHSRASRIAPRRLTVNGLEVRANSVVVATEAYTAEEKGQKRRLLPLNSSQIVTEQLTPEQWKSIGWAGCEGLSTTAHTYFYGQRTPDGRILLGGRGQPYTFGSGYDAYGRVDAATVGKLIDALTDAFPSVDVRVAHAYSGVLGVARDWSPYVEFDAAQSFLRVGAYAGQGVTAAYVAGRIAADLVLNRVSEFSESNWVRRAPIRWEPEPLRWVGAHALYAAYGVADRLEARSGDGKTSAVAKFADKLARR